MRNYLHNSRLHILTHHPGNQDQQNHPQHTHAFYAFRLHLHLLILQINLQYSPSLYPPRLQPKPLSCWCMDCSSHLRQSSCCMICTKDIPCHSHILQCCISCLAFYCHSVSHHTGMVYLGLLQHHIQIGPQHVHEQVG